MEEEKSPAPPSTAPPAAAEGDFAVSQEGIAALRERRREALGRVLYDALRREQGANLAAQLGLIA